MSSFTFVLLLKETQRSCRHSEMCLDLYFCPRVCNWCQLSSALRTQQQRFFAEAPEDSTFAHSGTRTRIKKPSWKMSWSKSWVEALLATASGCLSSTHIQTPRTGRSSGSRGPPSALSFQCRLLIWISEQSEFRTSQCYDDPNWSNIPCISNMKHRHLKHVEAKLLSEPYFVRRWKSPESSSLPKAPLTPQIYVYIIHIHS